MTLSISKEQWWIDLPDNLIEEMNKAGLVLEKTGIRYTVMDKRIMFPYAIRSKNNELFYVRYIPNSWARKARNGRVLNSLSVIEETAWKNDLNLIVITEQHLFAGVKIVAKAIFNRINPKEYSKPVLEIDEHRETVKIYDGKNYAGFANISAQKTMMTIDKWFSYIDPAFWVDELANKVGSASYKIKIHDDNPVPVQKILSWNTGIKRTEHNDLLNNDLRIYRSLGLHCARKTNLKREYNHELILPERGLARANYSIPTGVLVKDSSSLKNKISPKNSFEILNSAEKSTKYALFFCEFGHEYYAQIKGQHTEGCTICNSASVIEGINDLATTEPEIAKLWDYDANFPVRPTDVSRKSEKQFLWICPVSGGKWVSPVGRVVVTGGGSPFVAGLEILQGYNDLGTLFPFLPELFSEENDIKFPELRKSTPGKFLWHCKKCNGRWLRTVNSIIGNKGCRECLGYGKGSSKGEKEVYDYVSSIYDGVIHRGSRSIIPPKELDIYIPEKKIAIEYNGLYWHSEEMLKQRIGGSAKNYHYDKWKACRDAGVQLITVWEDEWRDKPEIVKSMLAHKLGLGQNGKVYGRNVIVLDIDGDTARDFCNKHHIQGFTGGAKYFALVDKSDLSEVYAVSIWRKLKNELYLDRYCTSTNVVGGMGKLLKAGEKWGKDMGCSQIITFADHQVSDGGLYHSLGFTMDKILNPDYRYIHEGLRKHKFGFRLKRFRNDPALKYVEGYTEKQLAELNDLPRLWDFGKTRFVKEIV